MFPNNTSIDITDYPIFHSFYIISDFFLPIFFQIDTPFEYRFVVGKFPEILDL